MTAARESPRDGTGSGGGHRRREDGAGRGGEGQGCPAGRERRGGRRPTAPGERLSRHSCPLAAFPGCFQRRHQLAAASPTKHSLTGKEEKQTKTTGTTASGSPYRRLLWGPAPAHPSLHPQTAATAAAAAAAAASSRLSSSRHDSPPRHAPHRTPPHGRHGQRPAGRCRSGQHPTHGNSRRGPSAPAQRSTGASGPGAVPAQLRSRALP